MNETTLHPNPSQVKGMTTHTPLQCIPCARAHKDQPDFRQRVSVTGPVMIDNGKRSAEVACLHCGHRWQSHHPAVIGA